MMRLLIVLCVAAGGWIGGQQVLSAPRQHVAGDVPEAVRQAGEALAGTHVITRWHSESNNGHIVYEAEWTDAGQDHEAKLTSDGELVEQEASLSSAQVPATVRRVAEGLLGAGPISYQRKLVVMYEAEAVIDGDEHELLICPTGAVLESHDDDDGDDGDDDDDDDGDGDDDDDDEIAIALDRVPPAVLDAARYAVPGIRLIEAEVETEDGVLVYELEGTLDGDTYEIEVAADGTVLEIERD